MPKWLIIVIAVVFAGCALCGGIVCLGFGKYKEMSQETGAEAEKLVGPFMKTWDSKTLEAVATPDLLRITPPEQLAVEAKAWSDKFGPYKSNSGWTMTAVNARSDASGTYTDSTLHTTGTFEKTTGRIEVILRKTGSTWKVHSLSIR